MTQKPEPTEEDLERDVMRARAGLDRAIERYIERRRQVRMQEADSGIADKAAPETR